MRLSKLIIILLIGLFTLPSAEVEGARRRKAKTTAVAKKGKSSKTAKSSRSSTKKKSNKKSSKSKSKRSSLNDRLRERKSKYSRRGRYKYDAAAAEAARLARAEKAAEKRREDSLRLRRGGTEPLQADKTPRLTPALELPIVRFQKADSTLSVVEIERLYFGRVKQSDDDLFFGRILPKVDSLIAKSNYKDAFVEAQQGLVRNPLHLGLLKRACDLAQHLNDKKLDTYIWQLAELFNMIQATGDGKSAKTATAVFDADDAYLYETLWLDHSHEQIVLRRSVKEGNKELLVLSVRNAKGKVEQRYYEIGAKR